MTVNSANGTIVFENCVVQKNETTMNVELNDESVVSNVIDLNGSFVVYYNSTPYSVSLVVPSDPTLDVKDDLASIKTP